MKTNILISHTADSKPDKTGGQQYSDISPISIHVHYASFSSQLTNGPKDVLHYARHKRLLRDKHSSLLGQLFSYKENEVL
jgi:hypothetical protein